MRRAVFFYLAIFYSMLNAQDKVVLYRTDHTQTAVPINLLDSICFVSSTENFTCGVTKVLYGNKEYNTVQIGSQCWMKENLNIGVMINGGQNQTDNSIIEKYCYNNDTYLCSVYGGLYQWREAMQYAPSDGSTQGICPSGWHVPSLQEYRILSDYVNNNSNALKAVGQGGGSGAGTNSSGFSAMLGGYAYNDGYFAWLTIQFIAWTSSSFTASGFLDYRIDTYSGGISANVDGTTILFAVRCIKDKQ